MSRNDLFKKSIECFFNKFKVEENGEPYSYILKQETQAKTGNYHIFSIRINSSNFESGITNNLPSIPEVEESINNFFEIYGDENKFVRIKTFCCNADIQQFEANYETSHVEYGRNMICVNMEGTRMKVYLEVRYANKSALPFNYEVSKDEEIRVLELKNRRLELLNISLKHDFREMENMHLHRIRRLNNGLKEKTKKYCTDMECMKKKNYNDTMKLTNKIIEMYDKSTERVNCPVCYDEIKPELLFVPGCGHFLCHSCADGCEKANGKCPLCRDFIYLHKHDDTGEEEQDNIFGITNPPRGI